MVIRLWCCTLECNDFFHKLQELERHAWSEHHRPFKCSECNAGPFLRLAEVQQHSKASHTFQRCRFCNEEHKASSMENHELINCRNNMESVYSRVRTIECDMGRNKTQFPIGYFQFYKIGPITYQLRQPLYTAPHATQLHQKRSIVFPIINTSFVTGFGPSTAIGDIRKFIALTHMTTLRQPRVSIPDQVLSIRTSQFGEVINAMRPRIRRAVAPGHPDEFYTTQHASCPSHQSHGLLPKLLDEVIHDARTVDRMRIIMTRENFATFHESVRAIPGYGAMFVPLIICKDCWNYCYNVPDYDLSFGMVFSRFLNGINGEVTTIPDVLPFSADEFYQTRPGAFITNQLISTLSEVGRLNHQLEKWIPVYKRYRPNGPDGAQLMNISYLAPIIAPIPPQYMAEFDLELDSMYIAGLALHEYSRDELESFIKLMRQLYTDDFCSRTPDLKLVNFRTIQFEEKVAQRKEQILEKLMPPLCRQVHLLFSAVGAPVPCADHNGLLQERKAATLMDLIRDSRSPQQTKVVVTVNTPQEYLNDLRGTPNVTPYAICYKCWTVCVEIPDFHAGYQVSYDTV